MRLSKFVLTSSVLLLSAAQLCGPKLLAQTPPAATPPAAPLPTAPTVNVYSREVVVDVTVTDSKGNPVRGLTQNDFTVTEEGNPIVPRSFKEHRSDDPLPPSSTPEGPPLPANTFTNTGAPETIRPIYVLMLDALDTPPATQSIVQKNMVDFIGKLAPGTRVAVFSLSATGRLSIVQGFTADQELLKKAIKSQKFSMQIPPLEDFGQDSTNMSAQDIPSMGGGGGRGGGGGMGGGGGGGGRGGGGGGGGGASAPQADANIECAHDGARGQYTISALTQIARYLSGMSGRKNLIWFTGAFPRSMRDKQNSVCFDLNRDLQVVDSLLERSHISLFPIDPRALDILAKNANTSYPARIQGVEHQTMDIMAEATGGRALYNNNDLSTAAAQAVITGSNYYTITYNPANQNFDTRLRTISIQVDKPNLTLVYKHGYHALAPGTTLSGAPAQPSATPLQSAMMPGTLQPTEILFNIAVAAADAPDTALPAGNNADPNVMKPPYRHLTLTYAIDAHEIQFDPSSDGNYHAQFEYAVSVYDPNDGKLLNSSIMAARPNVPPNVYQSVLNGGAKVRQVIDVPATGNYTLRIGVHDITTDRVGAIEVPTSSVAAGANPPIPDSPKP
jgi:VWFA-related protein